MHHDTCKIVTQLFPKACRICLGHVQIRMRHHLPDVGTSVLQVKSRQSPRWQVHSAVGRPGRVAPTLWTQHLGQGSAWKRSLEFGHWPRRPLITCLGSPGFMQRRQAERKDNASNTVALTHLLIIPLSICSRPALPEIWYKKMAHGVSPAAQGMSAPVVRNVSKWAWLRNQQV